MRLFPNQIKALEELICSVTQRKAILDNTIKTQIEKNKKWGAKDRRNFYQAAYDIIRNYELFLYLANENNSDVISTYIQSQQSAELDFVHLPFPIRYSSPDDFYKLFIAENNNAEDNLRAMHTIGDIFLRVNISLISFAKFEQKLQENNIQYIPIRELTIGDKKFNLNCIQLLQRTHTQRDFFEQHQRYFEIQDIGSHLLTEFTEPDKAKVIVEGCAGNGGKTTHLLDKTNSEPPLILCFDKERKKIEHLQTRIDKWQNHKVVTAVAKEKEILPYYNMADMLYLDVPCTGSGTLKRQADLKYRIDTENLNEKITIQRQVFQNFHPTLKSGGQLIYSTCSLFHSENQKQIDYILSQGYELIDQLLLEPFEYMGDGFFVAKLRKL